MTEDEAIQELEQLRIAYREGRQQIENKLAIMKSDYNRLVNAVVNRCESNELKQQVTTNIYYFDRNIPVDTLVTSLVRPNGLKAFAPSKYDVKWNDCEHTSIHEVTSRSGMKYDKYGFGTVDPSSIRGCPICYEITSKERADKMEIAASVLEEKTGRLKSMPYKEYLQADHWQGTRKQALKRAHYKCQLCYSGGQLNVHHKTYMHRGNENYSDLIVLCANCHAKFHDKLETEEEQS